MLIIAFIPRTHETLFLSFFLLSVHFSLTFWFVS